MSDQPELMKGVCPHCRATLIIPPHPLTKTAPKPDDAAVCSKCRRTVVVGADLRLRPATPTEVVDMLTDPEFPDQYDKAVAAMEADTVNERYARWVRAYRDQ